jgi:hypothetical protein
MFQIMQAGPFHNNRFRERGLRDARALLDFSVKLGTFAVTRCPGGQAGVTAERFTS